MAKPAWESIGDPEIMSKYYDLIVRSVRKRVQSGGASSAVPVGIEKLAKQN